MADLFDSRSRTEIAIARLKEFEPPVGYWFADSGGKDSSVVRDLLIRSGVRYEAHYNRAVEPLEVVRFIRDNHPETKIDLPEKTMWELIPMNRYPPTRVARYCCEDLKERGGGGRVVVTGIRWAESHRRAKRRMVESCFKDATKVYLHPIIDWPTAAVWQYIHENHVPYCSLYDEGWTRIGCVMCPMAGPKCMARDAERWPKIAAAYLRACDRAFELLPEERRKDWQCGRDMYDWWMSGKCGKVASEEQPVLIFE